MHVEALNWSGLAASHYAAAHCLSVVSLRRWRDLIQSGEVQIDWRAKLHPSALPKISSGLSSAAKASSSKTLLTGTPAVDPSQDGRSHRRRFSDAEKRAIAAECDLPGATAAEVCRRHAIVTSMLFRWRVQFGHSKKETVRMAAVRRSDSFEALVLQDLLPVPKGMAVVALSDGRRVFAPVGADTDAVHRHIVEREVAQ
jgi:transposase-like protein